jgi:hypothetical protein
MRYAFHLGLDYSGAGGPLQRNAGLQLFVASRGERPHRAGPPSATGRVRNWNRTELADELLRHLDGDAPVIVGIDHGFSFPESYFQRYGFKHWDALIDDFAERWPTDRRSVAELRAEGTGRNGDPGELRLTERWTSSAKSVFQFDVQGAVATSTHAGLPWLRKLRRTLGSKLHFWPFDGWNPPPGRSVVAEVYPSLVRARYPREGRSVDEQDAYAVARWLCEMDRRDRLERFFDPPLDRRERARARREGWILGVC